MGACQPKSLFILPDPFMACAEVQSVTSEGGPCTPLIEADADNCGNLVPQVFGVPEDTTQEDIQFLISSSGAGADGGGFLFRYPSDGLWIGADDGRRIQRAWGVTTSTETPFKLPNAHSLAYCADAKTLVAVIQDQPFGGFGTFEVFTRDIDGDYDSWSQASFDPRDVDAPALTDRYDFGKVALAYDPAKSVLYLAYSYLYREGPPDEYRVCVLKSHDCGTTWRMLVDNLFQDVGGFIISKEDHALRLTISGDWLRIDIPGESVTNAMLSTASNDGGLTWSPVVLGGTDHHQEPIARVYDPSPYDVVGIGGGRFLMVFNSDSVGTDNRIQHAQAFGGGAWATIGGSALQLFRDVPAQIVGIATVVSNDRVYAFISHQDGPGDESDDQISVYYHEIQGVLAHGPGGGLTPANPPEGYWQPVEPTSRYRGARFLPGHMTAVDLAGRAVMVMGGAIDLFDATVRTEDTLVFELGGLTVQSYGVLPPAERLTSGPLSPTPALHVVQWHAFTGQPAGGGGGAGGNSSADTLWTRVQAGPPIFAWNIRNWRVQTTNPGDLGYQRYLGTTVLANSWAQRGAVAGGIVRVLSGSSLGADSHGFYVQAIRSAGQELRVAVRMTTTTIRVRDHGAGVDRGDLAIDLTDYTEVRLHIAPGGASGTLYAARMDDYFNPPAFLTFSLGSIAAGSPQDEFGFGAFGTGANGESRWREAWVAADIPSDAEQTTPAAEGEGMLGLPLSTSPILVHNCISVAWGGGAGAQGDRYRTRPCFLYAASSALTDSGCIGWRSGGATPQAAQTLIFDLDPDGKDRTSVHDAIILGGLEDREVLVDYADTAGFGAPSPASTLDTTYWTGLEVVGTSRSILRVQAASGRRPNPSAISGQRWEFTSGPLAGERARILYACDDPSNASGILDLHMDRDISAALPGNMGDVFLTYGYVRHASSRRARYVRLRFNDLLTASGDHRLSYILAGCRLAPPFELEWTHGVANQDDTEIFEGPSVSWAYQRGKPRRIWTGRLVNDYTDWREAFVGMMRVLGKFRVHPMAVIHDDENLATMVRGRLEPPEMENAFWFDPKDGDGTQRYPGGDLRLRITEVP